MDWKAEAIKAYHEETRAIAQERIDTFSRLVMQLTGVRVPEGVTAYEVDDVRFGLAVRNDAYVLMVGRRCSVCGQKWVVSASPVKTKEMLGEVLSAPEIMFVCEGCSVKK